MKSKESRSYEWLVYLLVWTLVLLFPVINVLSDSTAGRVAAWPEVWRTWLGILPFLVLFLLHDRLLVPRLFLKHRVKSYLFAVLAVMALFVCYKYPVHGRSYLPIRMEQPAPEDRQERQPGTDDAGCRLQPQPETPPAFEERRPPEREVHQTGNNRMPLPLIMDTTIALLMLGFNLAVVLLFRYQQEKERNRELQTSHLQHELEYLKARLNPHFFMNMLNNIHGMVEIDPPRAQEMILGLSKLMRYVLYEGAAARTPFEREVNFIANYVALMRQRYSDRKVCIDISLPERLPGDLTIPPLLFIVFIENAFKHGISYRRPSFVEISLSAGETDIRFCCRNSNIHRDEPDRNRGVGLENIRKRLYLLYGDAYTLEIDDAPETYTVKLILPRL